MRAFFIFLGGIFIKSKITKIIENEQSQRYNSSGNYPSCQERSLTYDMTGNKKYNVSASLQPERGKYVVRGRVYDPISGKVRQRSKTTGLPIKDNKRKAKLVMKEIVAQWEREANAEVIHSDPLFSEYVQQWINKKAMSKRANTIKSYQDYAHIHILPELGKLKIRDMTLRHLQTYYSKKLKTLSVNSVKKHHVVISGALLDAVRDGIIQHNFAEYVEFPNAKKFEGKSYDESQVAALLLSLIHI